MMAGAHAMRFLIPGPAFEDSFADNVESALSEMGHEVIRLPAVSHAAYWSLPRHAWRVLSERVRGARWRSTPIATGCKKSSRWWRESVERLALSRAIGHSAAGDGFVERARAPL
jgi:hypothetical protein